MTTFSKNLGIRKIFSKSFHSAAPNHNAASQNPTHPRNEQRCKVRTNRSILNILISLNARSYYRDIPLPQPFHRPLPNFSKKVRWPINLGKFKISASIFLLNSLKVFFHPNISQHFKIAKLYDSFLFFSLSCLLAKFIGCSMVHFM